MPGTDFTAFDELCELKRLGMNFVFEENPVREKDGVCEILYAVYTARVSG